MINTFISSSILSVVSILICDMLISYYHHISIPTNKNHHQKF
ncbi:hypothetical protein [Blattabacterium cuenoti]|nr:hypothetical protein [Blattabacterium cuenoti]